MLNKYIDNADLDQNVVVSYYELLRTCTGHDIDTDLDIGNDLI